HFGPLHELLVEVLVDDLHGEAAHHELVRRRQPGDTGAEDRDGPAGRWFPRHIRSFRNVARRSRCCCIETQRIAPCTKWVNASLTATRSSALARPSRRPARAASSKPCSPWTSAYSVAMSVVTDTTG